jgi:hypothetical protein
MPAILPEAEVEAAHAAVEHAQAVRRLHRRRTDKNSPQRTADIDIALEQLKAVMRPLRTYIGKFPYGPQTDIAEANREIIYSASNAIQSERRKLWKMRAR